MLTTTSIVIIAVSVPLVAVMLVASLRDEHGDLVETVLLALCLGAFVCLVVTMFEVKADQEAAIAAIEDRYDIDVQESVFSEPGDWKIDDTWIRCFIPNEDADPAEATLSCDPTSTTAESYVDFADLD